MGGGLIVLSTARADNLDQLAVYLVPLGEVVIDPSAARDMLCYEVAKHSGEFLVHELVHPIPVDELKVILMNDLFCVG